VIFRNAGDGI